ncbi:hypothetical protein AVEN_262504-1 [Araneus ventricosus]|uniref:Uncharacterized protein n=1 Tax=Araneus ventricosus TaxID=182803 RepID=A0A4Y2LGH7_ARAVE|nr:hypothetical protein AVEN_262504-1 [Araneus ventricosus]
MDLSRWGRGPSFLRRAWGSHFPAGSFGPKPFGWAVPGGYQKKKNVLSIPLLLSGPFGNLLLVGGLEVLEFSRTAGVQTVEESDKSCTPMSRIRVHRILFPWNFHYDRNAFGKR